LLVQKQADEMMETLTIHEFGNEIIAGNFIVGYFSRKNKIDVVVFKSNAKIRCPNFQKYFLIQIKEYLSVQ